MNTPTHQKKSWYLVVLVISYIRIQYNITLFPKKSLFGPLNYLQLCIVNLTWEHDCVLQTMMNGLFHMGCNNVPRHAMQFT